MPRQDPSRKLDDYFRQNQDGLTVDKESIADITTALSEAKLRIYKVKIAFSLIKKLEIETGEAQADLYRKLIEMTLNNKKRF